MKKSRAIPRSTLVEILAAVFLTILLGRGFQARALPDLKPWHRADLGDVRAGELPDTATLADYLQREDAVFRALKERVQDAVPAEDRTAGNRYFAGGPLDPTRLPADGNRTFELLPEHDQGGALLIHGLTDAPYSVKPVAETLRRLGYYALAPRMPGHGTAPAGLASADWQDWMSVVRLAARHVRSRTGEGKPFVLVGYSNGGALAVKYAQDVLEGSGLPRPDRIVLLSPMIGVTPFAGFSRVASLLHRIPYFEKTAWLDVLPEYNPYKYSSFPANAALQTWELTKALNAQTERLAADGRLKDLAPVLTFQSLVDATVSTDAIVHRLYDRLPANGSELVLFDINRVGDLAPFLERPEQKLLLDLRARTDLRYRLTAITNARLDTRDVAALVRAGPGPSKARGGRPSASRGRRASSRSRTSRSRSPRATTSTAGCRSLRPRSASGSGASEPRGERSVLTVPFDQWMRLSWNPFFPYLEERVAAWAAISSSAR